MARFADLIGSTGHSEGSTPVPDAETLPLTSAPETHAEVSAAVAALTDSGDGDPGSLPPDPTAALAAAFHTAPRLDDEPHEQQFAALVSSFGSAGDDLLPQRAGRRRR